MAYDSETTDDIVDDAPESERGDDKPDSESKYELEVNLVKQLKKTKVGKAFLRQASKDIRDDYSTSWDGTEGHRQRVAKDWDLVSGILPDKSFPFENCLSADTEILTDHGWRVIAEVRVGEIVLTRRDSDGVLEWHPIERTVQQYADTLYHFKSASLDLQVTAGHEMIVCGLNGRTRRMPAEKVWATTGLRIPLTGTWPGGERSVLYGLDAGDCAEFIGWFLAEGTALKNSSISIAQSVEANPEKCARIRELLERLGFSWAYQRHAFTVHARTMPPALVQLLRGLGLQHERAVPAFLFTCDASVQLRVVEALVLGDGNISHGRQMYYTTSRALADGFQRLALGCGNHATIHVRDNVGKTAIASDGRVFTTRRIGYAMTMLTRTRAKVDRAKHAIVQYHDTAHCVTVKNHSIYVRRNGKAAFVGNCANLHVPTALENLMRLQTRMMEELFGDWTNVFGVVPVGPNADELADVLTLHANWQLREQIKDFQRQMHRATMSFLFIGDVSGESSYDSKTKLNRHEVLTVDDHLVPYTSTTTQPDYSDCPWRIRILRLYRHEIEARRDEWEDVDRILKDEPPSFEDEPDEPLAQHATESSEQEIDDAQRVKPYKLLRYEGWMDLPGEGRQRYIQAVVDHEHGHIFSLKLHEQENWQDRARFDYQMMELEAYEAALANRQMQIEGIQTQRALIESADAKGDGGPLNNMAMMGDLNEVEQSLPMPPPPDWLGESEDGQPRPVQMDAIRLGMHGVCIEPLKGNLGLSFGRIQADHNRAINVMVNQFVDSATFANVPCFVGAAGLQFNSNFEFKPGFINLSNLTADQMKSGIVPFPSPQPSVALFQTVEFLIRESASSMQSPNVLSGEPGKSGEPFKGLAARIEQASKALGTFTRKFMNEYLEPTVRNNAYLNSQFLPEDELVQITNQALGTVVEKRIGRSMYARNYAIVFRADLRFTSQTERVAEADEVLTMMMNPTLLQIMQNPGILYAAIKKSLQARGLHQFVTLLGAPPPQTQVFGQPPPPTPEQQAMMAQQQAQGGPPQGNGQAPPQQGQQPQQQGAQA